MTCEKRDLGSTRATRREATRLTTLIDRSIDRRGGGGEGGERVRPDRGVEYPEKGSRVQHTILQLIDSTSVSPPPAASPSLPSLMPVLPSPSPLHIVYEPGEIRQPRNPRVLLIRDEHRLHHHRGLMLIVMLLVVVLLLLLLLLLLMLMLMLLMLLMLLMRLLLALLRWPPITTAFLGSVATVGSDASSARRDRWRAQGGVEGCVYAGSSRPNVRLEMEA